MTLRDDGIVLFESKLGAKETLPDAKEVVAGYETLGGGACVRAVADIRNARGVDRAARHHYAGDEMAAVVEALAVVIDSGVSKVIGNFFMALNKPAIPMRLVTSVDDAIAWLNERSAR
jgi:hypothetical protein